MNLCRARSKQRRKSYATESLDEGAVHREVPAADRGPAAVAESHEELAALERAIHELPHDLRTALLLFAVEGHLQQECPELLDVSAKAVETRVYRARKRLESTLQASWLCSQAEGMV